MTFPTIFDYTNYHQFFHDDYRARRNLDGLTYHAYARLLDEPHRSSVYEILQTDDPKRTLTPTRARKWAYRLSLSPEATEYLVALVLLEAAQREEDWRYQNLQRADNPEPSARHHRSAVQDRERIETSLRGWKRLSTHQESPYIGMDPQAHAQIGGALERLRQEGDQFRPFCRLYRLIHALHSKELPTLFQEVRQFMARLAGELHVEQGEPVLLHVHIFPVSEVIPTRLPRTRPKAAEKNSEFDLFEYDDYHEALDEWFKTAKVSPSAFNTKAALKDGRLARKVRNKAASISVTLAQDFAFAMDLSPLETEYFVCLVDAQHNTDPEPARLKALALQSMVRTERVSNRQAELCKNTLVYWVLQELIRCGMGNHSSIGQLLMPPVPASEVAAALERMCQLDILSRTPNGGYINQVELWQTMPGLSISQARLDAHRELQARAAQFLGQPHSQQLDLRLRISPDHWPILQEEVDTFAKRLAGVCDAVASTPPDRVWHIGIQAVPGNR